MDFEEARQRRDAALAIANATRHARAEESDERLRRDIRDAFRHRGEPLPGARRLFAVPRPPSDPR